MSCKQIIKNATRCVGQGESAQTYQTRSQNVLRVADDDGWHGFEVQEKIYPSLRKFVPKIKMAEWCPVVQVPKCGETSGHTKKDSVLVVMEDAGHSLKHYWKDKMYMEHHRNEKEAVRSVCLAVLKFLQGFQDKHQGVHFDLHCGNVCVSVRGDVKIIDFDLSMTRDKKLPRHKWYPEYGIVHKDFTKLKGYDQVFFAHDFITYIKSPSLIQWVKETVAMGRDVDEKLERPLDTSGVTPRGALRLFFSDKYKRNGTQRSPGT
jgi:hypothetical protein